MELFARLQEEVGKGGTGGADRGAARLRARRQAERAWPVSAERSRGERGGPVGLLSRPTKQVLRRLMRWYVEPFAADQRTFNDAALKLLDLLQEHLDELAGRAGDAEARVAELEAGSRLATELDERLLRLERRPAAAPGRAAAEPPTEQDYFAFEARMRGSVEEIRERQRPYLDDLRDAGPVLDLGCGRGELLALLREAGVEASGVDADGDMAAFARGDGLDVAHADALSHLAALADGSLGAAVGLQLAEHLDPPRLLRLLELAHAKLRPGGLLLLETINPLAPASLRNYFADLTHAQPLVPETLALLVRHAGFREPDTRYLNPPTARPARPSPVEEIVFAPLDYAILARA